MYLGNGIGIIAEDSASPTGCSQLFSTVDSVHWHNISPPQTSSTGETCPDIWQSASFISPTRGWVLGRDGYDTTTVLYSTDDGGASWTREMGSSTGSNGGVQVIGFTSEGEGWRQQFPTGSNTPYLLETTSDGGETWNELPQESANAGCPFALDVFANPMDGFAGSGFGAMSEMGTPPPQAFLWQTTDGGSLWHEAVAPRPAAFVDADAYYGLPTFFDTTDGVLPVDYELDGVATMAFYSTSNAGASWSLSSTVKTVSTVRAVPGTTTCSASETQGVFPSVGVADATTWWVIGAGGTDLEVTINGGQTWSDVKPAGIAPAAIGANVSFSGAVGSTVAWVTFSDEATGPQSFQTTDGGRTWSPIEIPPVGPSTPSTPAPPPAPSCANDQLTIALGGSGAGLGHEGQTLLFTNVSTATCTLFGYPGVAGLDDAGRQVMQAARTLSGYLGGLWISPEGSPPTVTLAPQQTASALVEWTDNQVGSTPCLQLRGLLVTAPNTTRSVDLPAPAAPCAGMEVHPVVPGSSGTIGE